MQWRIRKAIPEDAEGLQSCMEAAYSAYQERMGNKELPPMNLDYSQELVLYPTWVAESDGRVVGGLIMTFEDDIASIANIAVHPQFQGHKLGSELMKFAESTARDSDCSELQLATHPLLTENIAIYEHLGWIEFERDMSRVRMTKDVL